MKAAAWPVVSMEDDIESKDLYYGCHRSGDHIDDDTILTPEKVTVFDSWGSTEQKKAGQASRKDDDSFSEGVEPAVVGDDDRDNVGRVGISVGIFDDLRCHMLCGWGLEIAEGR